MPRGGCNCHCQPPQRELQQHQLMFGRQEICDRPTFNKVSSGGWMHSADVMTSDWFVSSNICRTSNTCGQSGAAFGSKLRFECCLSVAGSGEDQVQDLSWYGASKFTLRLDTSYVFPPITPWTWTFFQGQCVTTTQTWVINHTGT